MVVWSQGKWKVRSGAKGRGVEGNGCFKGLSLDPTSQ